MILGQGAFMRRVILRPIKHITDEATRFADENKPPVMRIGETVRNQDEIGLLADTIDSMEDQVDRYINNITHIRCSSLSMAVRYIAELEETRRRRLMQPKEACIGVVCKL